MASPGNPSPPGGGPFDMHKLFKPSAPPPPPATSISSSNPNLQTFTSNASNANTNPNLVSASLLPPSVSYPPPTGAGGGPYYSPQIPPYHYHQVYTAYSNPSPPNQEFANLQPQRSMSYPTPPLQPQVQTPTSMHHHNLQNPPNPQNPNNPWARLMAPPSMLDIPPQSAVSFAQIHPTSSSGSDFAAAQSVNMPPGLGLGIPPVIRMPSHKLPKGRHLTGDHLVYDVDVRLPGEVQPQLEVAPITKYVSDPGLVLGRQIAVNKTYICYGLRSEKIRVLNINTALRSLLQGLAQRVTDMAFFAEDVHLLASASVGGRVYVWTITEGPDDEDKPQIAGRIVIAIQVTGEGESIHPRVCWHCHKQEVLVVGIGRLVLKIDTTKVGKGENFSAEEPLKCPTDKLIDGIQLVGSHDGEVTDLSMCQWMTTRLVSASVDGTVKIWEDRKSLPLAVLRPHDGQPVNSITFLAAPHRPDHIILITGGPLNREIKIWISASEEGWLLPIDAESWRCTQTLLLKSSEVRLEDAFFNQVVALSQAGLLLLANAKKNAIYAVHLEYGPNPAATRFDYIAEFTVTMPILSFIGTSELLPHCEQIVRVYCVQTQAIQQYALDLSQCLPPPMEHVPYEKSGSMVSQDAASTEGFATVEPSGSKPAEISVSSSAPKTSIHETGLEKEPKHIYPVGAASAESPTLQDFASSNMESKPVKLSTAANECDLSVATLSSLPLSPRVSRTLSGFRSSSSSFEHVPVNERTADQKIADSSVDRQIDANHANLSDIPSLDDDSRNDDSKLSQDDISMALNNPIKFKRSTHLVTPSEILMASSSSEVNHTNEPPSEGELNFQKVVVSNDTRNVEVEVKVVGETRFGENVDTGSRELQTFVSENKEKAFCSQASDLGMDMARECHALSPEIYTVEEAKPFIGTEVDTQPSTIVEEVHDSAKDVTGKVVDPSTYMPAQHTEPSRKGRKQKEKSAQGSGLLSSSRSAFNSIDSSVEPGISSSTTPVGTTVSHILSMQEILNQLTSMQKEMQKQMAVMVAVPITKEGKRLEAALGRSIEKAVKANCDALLARLQEENAKQEKTARERMQQLTNMISNCLNKDLPAIIEKNVRRELTTLGQSVARTINPTIERTISTSITENFQKGVGDKAVNQLEKLVSSKLEATVARQIQTQFQTSGKHALQEVLKSSLEVSLIPAFEGSCRTMFEQVDAAFQKGMVEHTTAAQQHIEASHSPLALALRDAINSATSLGSDLLDGQRKLLALPVAGEAPNLLISQRSNSPLGGLHEKLEVPPDTAKELSRLIAERKYEEAFTAALHMSDVTIVSWLCSQVHLPGILSMNPIPLGQSVLLALLQQLACSISKDTPRKLTWMWEVLPAINPTDPVILVHVSILGQVNQMLIDHCNLPTTSSAELSKIRWVMRAIHSMLTSSK